MAGGGVSRRRDFGLRSLASALYLVASLAVSGASPFFVLAQPARWRLLVGELVGLTDQRLFAPEPSRVFSLFEVCVTSNPDVQAGTHYERYDAEAARRICADSPLRSYQGDLASQLDRRVAKGTREYRLLDEVDGRDQDALWDRLLGHYGARAKGARVVLLQHEVNLELGERNRFFRTHVRRVWRSDS